MMSLWMQLRIQLVIYMQLVILTLQHIQVVN